MHLSLAGNPTTPQGLASDQSDSIISSKFEFLNLKTYNFMYDNTYFLKMHLTPAGHQPSPLGLASDQSNDYFSSEFEFLDLKNL